MNIRIVNLRNYTPLPNEVLIKIDRTSVLGNPFVMHEEYQRDDVCNAYKSYFDTHINKTLNPAKDTDFDKALSRILDALSVSNVALGCWCAPKRCHAETIMEYVVGKMFLSVCDQKILGGY